ncbi:DUF6090 family protein [Flavobacteriaceae bacterium S0825]|uniref:DUF6090 family protein n=1 Tax=Gaetbulibacter sp. S0825 TaxID=2720084 RepID=UPI0014302FA9|nr:DUF6090 family protein [Gaetbulibacter sp. S0825]MCK0109242.1 DUF6090 family protein [Flavobacteriaceae bacterium S0825]NIX64877.1 hypothetical protein [Gaetbulibacter sp. S0825]
MIKFFRHIRKSLLMENKTGKYFKYAIGEIILVMIGILLALQVNNWNQKRLAEKQIYNYLVSLKKDLETDIVLFEDNIKGYELDKANNSQILMNDDYKKFDVDSITTLVSGFWNLNRTSDQTYQKIKSAGLLEMLGTPEINKAVNNYYNIYISHYDYLIEWDRELTEKDGAFWFYSDNFETNVLRGLESSTLPFRDNPDKRKQDLINLTESTIGRNYLRNAIARDEYGIGIVNDTKAEADRILELIENEIEKR